MRIAILAGGDGEKALFLYDFFKEGDRITVDCVLTDDASSPVAQAFRKEGISVFEIDDTPSEEILQRLKSHDVKVLVEDGYSGPVPSGLRDFFGEGIVTPSTPTASPLEVIKVADRLLTPPEQKHPVQARKREAEEERSIEDEWASALNQEEQAPAANSADGPSQPSVQPPVPPVVPPYEPRAWFGQGPSAQSAAPQQQPAAQQAAQPEPMPDTYLVWSVVITILFSMIPGIIAIIYSSKVSSKYYMGNIEGAKRCSRNAQIWCIVSIILGILWMTFYLPLVLLSA